MLQLQNIQARSNREDFIRTCRTFITATYSTCDISKYLHVSSRVSDGGLLDIFTYYSCSIDLKLFGLIL